MSPYPVHCPDCEQPIGWAPNVAEDSDENIIATGVCDCLNRTWWINCPPGSTHIQDWGWRQS